MLTAHLLLCASAEALVMSLLDASVFVQAAAC